MARRKKARAGEGAVPTDSFSDIAFLLIVFFLLVTTLVKTRGFETQLPSTKESPQSQENEVPAIAIEGENILYQDNKVTLDELRSRLHALELAGKEEKLRIVTLKARRSVKYGVYYKVWAAIVNAGGIVTMIKEKD